MQPNFAIPAKLSFWERLAGGLAMLLAVLALGCQEKTTSGVMTPKLPYPGVQLKVACADATVATELSHRARTWSQRSGATVTFQADSRDADCVVTSPRTLGAWIAKKEVLPVPDSIRSSEHSFKWFGLISMYSERLGEWNGQVYAIPLAGEGYVLAYHEEKFADKVTADAFAQKFGRALAPPATWEDFADIAEFFADRGSPSLPPLANEPGRLATEWSMIAACYDRLAQSTNALAAQLRENKDRHTPTVRMLSFHHDLETGEPRLTQRSFVQAAALLKRLHRCRAPQAAGSVDPATSLARGTAVMAVLSLRELGQLPKTNATAPANIGLAPMMGTKSCYDPKAAELKLPTEKVSGANYIPYFGSQSLVGLVRSTATNADAAFALLTDLASQDRSIELISDPKLGFGPLRLEHLDQSREPIWQRYGFDAVRNRKLAEAIRSFLAIGLANPVYVLRTSDQAVLMDAVEKELQAAMTSTTTPEDAMTKAQAEWKRLDATRPVDERKAERRRSSGVGAGE